MTLSRRLERSLQDNVRVGDGDSNTCTIAYLVAPFITFPFPVRAVLYTV